MCVKEGLTNVYMSHTLKTNILNCISFDREVLSISCVYLEPKPHREEVRLIFNVFGKYKGEILKLVSQKNLGLD